MALFRRRSPSDGELIGNLERANAAVAAAEAERAPARQAALDAERAQYGLLRELGSITTADQILGVVPNDEGGNKMVARCEGGAWIVRCVWSDGYGKIERTYSSWEELLRGEATFWKPSELWEVHPELAEAFRSS